MSPFKAPPSASGSKGAATRQPSQFCTFFVGDLFLGVPVLEVQEVIRYQEMTRVPLGPPEVQGLINLRGQIVTAIDLRRMLGLAPLGSNRKPMNVVVRAGDEALSLLVDEIGDVLDLPADSFGPCPPTSHRASRELLRGVCQLQDRLLLLLDVDRVAAVRADAYVAPGLGNAGHANSHSSP